MCFFSSIGASPYVSMQIVLNPFYYRPGVGCKRCRNAVFRSGTTAGAGRCSGAVFGAVETSYSIRPLAINPGSPYYVTMKLGWLTDIHLNFLNPADLTEFVVFLAKQEVGAFVITGDIAEGNTITKYLKILSDAIGKPVYFVLGNHDYYRGAIERVREEVANVCRMHDNLIWLNEAGVVPLTESAALVGHDGWADGRDGDYKNTDVLLSDHVLIRDFARCGKDERLELMQKLAGEAVGHFEKYLREALGKYEKVYLAVHPVPFKEACLYNGKMSSDDFLPHFASKVIGEKLTEIMQEYPERKLIVLCGHVHYPAEMDILPNMKVIVGGARYGSPQVQRVFEV
jgi:Icc protein